MRIVAAMGHLVAGSNVGAMYFNGQGVPQNYAEALKSYHKVADLGFATAQNNLGAMYANGQGVAKDDEQAFVWYRKATAGATSGVYARCRRAVQTQANLPFWSGSHVLFASVSTTSRYRSSRRSSVGTQISVIRM
jgi:TPR repeat protein